MSRRFLFFTCFFLVFWVFRASAQSRQPKTLVVALGGVSWSDWARIAAPQPTQNGANWPILHQVLGQSALASARLSGGPSDDLALKDRARISPAMLRTALSLSRGEDLETAIPASYAITLAPSDLLIGGLPTSENATVGEAFQRRTGLESKSGWQYNLGLARGFLGEFANQTDGRAVAFGNGDTDIRRGRALPLREWAVIAADLNGAVHGGEVSPLLLTGDANAPFGVRQDHLLTARAVISALEAPDVSLIALDWGDTRRAALYAPFSMPEIALKNRELAILRFDFLLKSLLPRFNIGDQLVLIAIPDLDSSDAQQLPIAVWQPDGNGGVLQTKSGDGLLSVGELGNRLTKQVGSNRRMFQAKTDQNTVGQRVENLMALQSAQTWLENARGPFQAIWAAIFGLALLISLAAMLAPTRRQNWRILARTLWILAMLWPLFAWLAGVCLEVVRRASAASESGLIVALVAFALLLMGVATLLREWFAPRLRRAQIGVAWAAFSVVGLWLGGFALEWNGLLNLAPLDWNRGRMPDAWSLWLVGASLLGVAGLIGGPNEGEKRVLNPRPATLWLLAIVALIGWRDWGGQWDAGLVALASFGWFALKFWAARPNCWVWIRKPNRIWRVLWLLGVYFLWRFVTPMGWPIQAAPSWNGLGWWLLVEAIFVAALIVLASSPRLFEVAGRPRFATRAMLQASGVAVVVALPFFGIAAIPLLLFWPLAGLGLEWLGNLRGEWCA